MRHAACVAGLFVALLVLPAGGESAVVWTSGDQLLPAWGFYPNGSSYGGTGPSGKASAWTASGGTHRLTWVVDLPGQQTWQMWVRQYGGYGKIELSVDERPVAGGRGGPGGGRYVWRHLGSCQLAPGSHHVDVSVHNGMLDAVLLAADAGFDPQQGPLPPQQQLGPRLRGLRAYRDDSHLAGRAGERGYVTAPVAAYEEIGYDWLPPADVPPCVVRLWGAANQYVSGTFALRTVRGLKDLRVSLGELRGPGGKRLTAENIDLRVVQVRLRPMVMPAARGGGNQLLPDLLLRADGAELPPRGEQGGFGGGLCTTSVPAHQSRQFWITVRVPAGTPGGAYRGTIRLAEGDRGPPGEVPVELEVLSVELRPAEGYYSIYYPSQASDPKRNNYISRERFAAELADQVRHGLNSITLYGDSSLLEMVARSGMTRAPCLMHWPSGEAQEEIARARQLGLEGVLYYGVDEPRTPAAIERCRKEAVRRQKLGLPMMTAINDRKAQEALRDLVSHPVYVSYVFDGPNNPQVAYVRSKGFRPISYWTTAVSFPLFYRAMAGLYNTACGYQGTAPWAYQDYPDNRLYTQPAHAVAYPDAAGRPIPTLRWEAFRDGVDDVRYLEALDRAIRAGTKRIKAADPPAGLAAALDHAREVRKNQFESISGRWFQYVNRLAPGDLDQVRRRLADATVRLVQVMSP